MHVKKLGMWVRAVFVAVAATLALAAPAVQAANAADPSPELTDNTVCLGCHGNEGFEMPGPDGAMRKLYVNLDKFANSKHGPLSCVMCHESITSIPHKESAREGRVKCANCHVEQGEQYGKSVHAAERARGNMNAPTCSNCHTQHEIHSPSEDQTRLMITKNCGNCHKENFKSYTDTYHGQVNTLGYAYTAKCFDCHGNHGIKRVTDPESTVHPDNRLATCQKCHTGATAGFLTFQPHANTHDFERYPAMYITSKFMIALLFGVFAFFWLHSALWFYREYKERGEHRTIKHVLVDELMPKSGKHVRRFGPWWRLGHLVFALSVMTLVLTGMTVFYPNSAWAPEVARALGGARNAALIHRIAATTMLSIFFVHVVYMAMRVVPDWRPRDWFGPNSFVPRWKDLEDAIGMFRWFFGKGPKPMFDRWTYWEKFDYWAVFWGMAVIGGSGLMLAFPNQTASVLPGWVFNIATLVHGEEAFLAAVFLFTVHFFNNHFRPEKYPPPDITMFVGAVPLEEFKREHAAQYERLVKSGELEKCLVDAPSRPMTIASRVLGLVLITFGLTLLVLVFTGFFGAVH
jgi:cytochrome b subunit of formate dehydrogenase